jgi:hypothetical protein
VRRALVAPIAERMAERLGWDRARREQEILATIERLAVDLDFRGES